MVNSSPSWVVFSVFQYLFSAGISLASVREAQFRLCVTLALARVISQLHTTFSDPLLHNSYFLGDFVASSFCSRALIFFKKRCEFSLFCKNLITWLFFLGLLAQCFRSLRQQINYKLTYFHPMMDKYVRLILFV